MSRFVVALVLLAAVVAVSARPDHCPKNEHWDICGDICEPTCQLQHPNRLICPTIECTKELSGCRCNEGLVRLNGACVEPSKCPPSKE